ncbi:MAG: hypothetical protein AB1700_04650 [Bacillota bacterium]
MATSNNPFQKAEVSQCWVVVAVDRAYWACYNFTKLANGQTD